MSNSNCRIDKWVLLDIYDRIGDIVDRSDEEDQILEPNLFGVVWLNEEVEQMDLVFMALEGTIRVRSKFLEE